MSKIEFSDVKHKYDNQKELVFQANLDNGQLKAKMYIFKEKFKLPVGYYFMPKWAIYIISLISVLLLTLHISALVILLKNKSPGLYLENCESRSCKSGHNMQCINNICSCASDEYYAASCIVKKNYQDNCLYTYQCKDGMNLICWDGICDCGAAAYWNGESCFPSHSYRNICSIYTNQCSTLSMLYCNKTLGLCLCSSER